MAGHPPLAPALVRVFLVPEKVAPGVKPAEQAVCTVQPEVGPLQGIFLPFPSAQEGASLLPSPKNACCPHLSPAISRQLMILAQHTTQSINVDELGLTKLEL